MTDEPISVMTDADLVRKWIKTSFWLGAFEGAFFGFIIGVVFVFLIYTFPLIN